MRRGASGDHPVAVPRSALRSLRLSVGLVLALAVVAGVPLAVSEVRQHGYNAHLADTDEELAATTEELEDLVAREAREEDLEEAAACVGQHERYDAFLTLAEDLTRAGASVAIGVGLVLLEGDEADKAAADGLVDQLLPPAVQPLIDSYPPPDCDVDAARRLIAASDEPNRPPG